MDTFLAGRMLAVEHLALTTLNLMVHWRATSFDSNPVDEAGVIAEGLLATFADARIDDPALRVAAIAAMREQGAALVDAAERLAAARQNDVG